MTSTTPDAVLAPKAAKALCRLCQELQQALGDDLVAVIAHGPAVRADPGDSASAHPHVLVVVSKTTVDRLDAMSRPIRRAERTCGAHVQVLCEPDLERSADALAVPLADMQESHLLLAGRDVLSELEIDDQALRLDCERRLREQLLHLRNRYVHCAHRPLLLKRVLSEALPAFLDSMRVFLLLEEELVPDDHVGLAHVVQDKLQLESDALVRLCERRRAARGLGRAEVHPFTAAVLDALAKATRYVDRAGDAA